MIKNVVFDMGGVLISYDMREYARRFARNEDDALTLYNEVFRSVEWVMQDRGTLTPDQTRDAITARLPARLAPAVADLFANWHRDGIPPFGDMELLAKELHEKGWGVYLLSNTSLGFHTFRENIPALKYFDGEFISADCGLLKPDPAIYALFCKTFGLAPAECFFIDDAPGNIEGALRAGMQGFVYHGRVDALRNALAAAGVAVACTGQ